jgi:hypothetical protein
MGGTTRDSLTAGTNLVIWAGGKASTKVTSARAKKIPVLDGEAFKRLLDGESLDKVIGSA